MAVSVLLAVLAALGVGGWVKSRRFLPSGGLAVMAAAAMAIVQSFAHVSPTTALNGAGAEIRDAPPVTTLEKDPTEELDDGVLEDSWPLVVAVDKDHNQDAAKNQAAEVAALKAR